MTAYGPILLAVALAASSVGCASTLKVTYYSDPQGAALYANASGQYFGQTPVTLNYKPSPAFRRGQACFVLQPVRVRWASGAEASETGIQVCPANGLNQQFVFVRPADAPQRELDVMAAASAQQAALLQQQIAAAQRAEALQSLSESAGRLGRALAGAGPSEVSSSSHTATSSVVESRIRGAFEGWTGETLFELQNGQIWRQDRYAYHYHYAYSPRVVIYRVSTGYEMKVDGVTPTVRVVRLR